MRSIWHLGPNSPLVAELREIAKQNVTTLPLRNSLDAKSARELSQLVRKHQIQIVHAHMARDYPLQRMRYVKIKKRGWLLLDMFFSR
jgi:hypothetical protein